jgi:SAM-dependent methyltransferase
LLEIGCASGEFLSEAGSRGWKFTAGVEIDSKMVDTGRKSGINIYEGFFEELDFNDEKFNMIFADNVIEHVMSPLNTLKKCNALQNTGDILALRLPDTQLYGPTLKLIDHTFHFTQRSITSILELAGYKTEKIFYSGTFYGTGYPEKSNNKILNMTVIARKSTNIT